MKSAFITACKAFTNQVKQNYKERIVKEYVRLTSKEKPAIRK